ncbi:uncharacterized protein LOC129302821 [Prosopis cineraria]|uniref:uncharacterized protein LOC129302821 n=1 Tax=Prosopis cineraria TaxID=364024 RepID=UPI00240FB7E8|nr:uncharacterized protein LOC129302821 [Prosopis cineraria]
MRVDVDASLNHQNNAACGWLPRNSEGQWLQGFVWNLGNLPIAIAEVHAINCGLQLYSSLNFDEARIYSDSLDAINLIYRGVHSDHPFADAISRVQKTTCAPRDNKILHISRDANSCADFLARMAQGYGSDFTLLIDAPPSYDSLILLDENGVNPHMN